MFWLGIGFLAGGIIAGLMVCILAVGANADYDRRTWYDEE
jgi:hypothetical protein